MLSDTPTASGETCFWSPTTSTCLAMRGEAIFTPLVCVALVIVHTKQAGGYENGFTTHGQVCRPRRSAESAVTSDCEASSSTTRSNEATSAGRHWAIRQVGMIQHGTALAQSTIAAARSAR